jgi:hypothetical protein
MRPISQRAFIKLYAAGSVNTLLAACGKFSNSKGMENTKW